MSAVVDVEPFSAALYAQIMPLAQKCWDESTLIKGESCAYYGDRDYDIAPHIAMYQDLADKGKLVIVTLRIDRELRGYVEGFVYPCPHHSKIIGSIGDSMYVEPGYRSYAALLVDRFESEMQKLGAGIIGWPTHPDGALCELLKAKGFVGDDIVMEKRLCA